MIPSQELVAAIWALVEALVGAAEADRLRNKYEER